MYASECWYSIGSGSSVMNGGPASAACEASSEKLAATTFRKAYPCPLVFLSLTFFKEALLFLNEAERTPRQSVAIPTATGSLSSLLWTSYET